VCSASGDDLEGEHEEACPDKDKKFSWLANMTVITNETRMKLCTFALRIFPSPCTELRRRDGTFGRSIFRRKHPKHKSPAHVRAKRCIGRIEVVSKDGKTVLLPVPVVAAPDC
jgi:hypothetical protein